MEQMSLIIPQFAHKLHWGHTREPAPHQMKCWTVEYCKRLQQMTEPRCLWAWDIDSPLHPFFSVHTLSLSPSLSQSWHDVTLTLCAADVGRVHVVWVACVTLGGDPGGFVQDTTGIDWQLQLLPERNMPGGERCLPLAIYTSIPLFEILCQLGPHQEYMLQFKHLRVFKLNLMFIFYVATS